MMSLDGLETYHRTSDWRGGCCQNRFGSAGTGGSMSELCKEAYSTQEMVVPKKTLWILFLPLCFRLLPIAFRLQQLAGDRRFLLCNRLLAFLLMRWRRFL